MPRIAKLWESDELHIYRFDHPADSDDRPYRETAEVFRASFVEDGDFNLEVGEARWRVGTGDVMLSHPGMTFWAGFKGECFADTCLSVVYKRGAEDGFEWPWTRAGEYVARRSNRSRFLQWGLQRAMREDDKMLAEYCAAEIFRDPSAPNGALYTERKFVWCAERIHAARERLHTRYDEEHTISGLARQAGMSMFHFARVFTELVGAPPHQYLGERRLAAAKTMIEDGRSVTETCYAVGFNNLSHFSRRFARRFGAAPSRIGDSGDAEI
jgi:AraC-like DNA-binding protein